MSMAETARKKYKESGAIKVKKIKIKQLRALITQGKRIDMARYQN